MPMSNSTHFGIAEALLIGLPVATRSSRPSLLAFPTKGARYPPINPNKNKTCFFTSSFQNIQEKSTNNTLRHVRHHSSSHLILVPHQHCMMDFVVLLQRDLQCKHKFSFIRSVALTQELSFTVKSDQTTVRHLTIQIIRFNVIIISDRNS